MRSDRGASTSRTRSEAAAVQGVAAWWSSVLNGAGGGGGGGGLAKKGIVGRVRGSARTDVEMRLRLRWVMSTGLSRRKVKHDSTLQLELGQHSFCSPMCCLAS